MMLIGLVGSTIAGGIWGKKGAIIFGIVFAVFSFGTSLLGSSVSLLSTFSTVASIASSIANVYFMYAMDDIMKEAKKIADDTEEIKDAIVEMSKEMLYLPFGDVLDAIEYVTYEAVYDIYNEYFDYDQFTKISTLKNYEPKGISYE